MDQADVYPDYQTLLDENQRLVEELTEAERELNHTREVLDEWNDPKRPLHEIVDEIVFRHREEYSKRGHAERRLRDVIFTTTGVI